MKSTDITNRLKELFDVSTNDEIVPAIETALGAKSTPPLGATVYISGGKLFPPAIFGLSNPPKLVEIEALQRAFRAMADALDRDRTALIRAEVEAEMNKVERQE